jgi:hypothetical protein
MPENFSNPYSVKQHPGYSRQVKRLIKKYPSLKYELEILYSQIEVNPEMGKAIGRSCYKIRLPIASKGGGKSDGARVITLVVHVQEKVVLLSIYDKKEQDTISDNELRKLIDGVK